MLLNTARTAGGEAGSRLAGIYFSLISPPLAEWGLPIKVLVTFGREGQGFDWAFLSNWAHNEHRHSEGPFKGCSHAACEAESCGAHTVSAVSRQLQHSVIYV